jgi:hypothetical protein
MYMASTTTPGTSRQALLRRVAQGYRALRSALEALPRERFNEKLATGWSLNENLAHLAAWEETVSPRVARVLESGEDPKLYDEIDSFNARVASDARGKSTDDLFARWTAAHEGLLATIRDLPEDAPALAVDVVEWNTASHYPDHFADIGAAIRDANDLVRVIQTNWLPFRLGLLSMGLPALERPTSTGWTYKDVAAHAAAWEERTAKRLARFRASGDAGPGVDDTDAFNAGVVERTRGRDPADVLRELDQAHEALVAEVSKLTPEQIHRGEDWAIAVVAGNSYGHYAEHHDEVFAAVPRKPSELLARMRESWRPFRNAVGRLGLVPLAAKTPSGWTYKGMLGHVANWMEKSGPELPIRLQGRRSEDLPDVDAENRREADASASRSAHEVVHRLDAAYRALVEAVKALPADEDVHFMAVRLICGDTYGHFPGHLPEILAALPKDAPAMLVRFDDVWRRFRAAIHERGRGGLGARTPAGWTYKDLCAHAAAWMQESVRELAANEFTDWNARTIQEFNDRAVDAHRLVGPEAMLDELDTSARRMREVIATLSPEQIANEKVFDVAAWCSYLHWEDHFAELGIAS